MAKDYYEILGVNKSASIDQIKRSYRDLALKYHPDRNKNSGAEEKFKEINEAYAVLSDPQKRSQYDMLGPTQFNQQFTPDDIFRGFDFDRMFRDFGFDSGFNEQIFQTMFGFNPQNVRRVDRGNDILARMVVTHEEASQGTKKTFGVRHLIKCDRCKGSGAEPNTSIIKCDRCKGMGQISERRVTGPIMMQTISTCPQCQGTGKSFERLCKKCGSRGYIQSEEKVEVTIPKGVRTGQKLRLKGIGDYGKDEAGDLYIDVHVQSDGRSKPDPSDKKRRFGMF